MDPAVLLSLSSILGALGVYLILRPGRGAARLFGVVLAIAGAGTMLGQLPSMLGGEIGDRPTVFFYTFRGDRHCGRRPDDL